MPNGAHFNFRSNIESNKIFSRNIFSMIKCCQTFQPNANSISMLNQVIQIDSDANTKYDL